MLFQAYENVFIQTTPELPLFLKHQNLQTFQGRNCPPSYALQRAEYNDGTKCIKQGQ